MADPTAPVWTPEQTLKRDQQQHEHRLQLKREETVRTVTFGMLGAFVLMIIATYVVLFTATDPIFGRAKDLLLFINPLIGVVIGYYFNKVTSEARAEKAETAVRDATAQAQEAELGRREAVSTAQTAEAAKTEAVGTLGELAQAAQANLNAHGFMQGERGTTRGLPESAPSASQVILERALADAQRVVAKHR
jgi:hypothetical protein